MKVFTDEKIEKELKNRYVAITRTGKKTYTKASNALRTFKLIREIGFNETKRLTPKQTFWDHVNMISSCGVSLAHLQSMDRNGAVVVPLVRYINVDFRDQQPEWANVA